MTWFNASLRGYPDWSVYAASKAVLPAYARVWVSELRDRKIRVNVLTPGSVITPLQRLGLRCETPRPHSVGPHGPAQPPRWRRDCRTRTARKAHRPSGATEIAPPGSSWPFADCSG